MCQHLHEAGDWIGGLIFCVGMLIAIGYLAFGIWMFRKHRWDHD